MKLFYSILVNKRGEKPKLRSRTHDANDLSIQSDGSNVQMRVQLPDGQTVVLFMTERDAIRFAARLIIRVY